MVEGIVGIRQWEVIVRRASPITPAPRRWTGGRTRCLGGRTFIADGQPRRAGASRGGRWARWGGSRSFPARRNVIPGRVDVDAGAARSRRRQGAAAWPSRSWRRRARSRAPTEPTCQLRAAAREHRGADRPADARADHRGGAGRSGSARSVMPSGAGHDAQAMAQIGPVGMIFVPSIGGISHSPKEFSRPEDIANGANVLLQTLPRAGRALTASGRAADARSPVPLAVGGSANAPFRVLVVGRSEQPPAAPR